MKTLPHFQKAGADYVMVCRQRDGAVYWVIGDDLRPRLEMVPHKSVKTADRKGRR